MKFSTKKITLLSLLVAVAMILSYVESLIPPLAAIPGVKIGLSNIATLFALYALGWRSAACVSLVRVCLSALLFGNFVGFIYSLSGAIFAAIAAGKEAGGYDTYDEACDRYLNGNATPGRICNNAQIYVLNGCKVSTYHGKCI